MNGKRYRYNTPNDGCREIGIMQWNHADHWAVCYLGSDNKPHALNVVKLPQALGQAAAQRAFEQWAEKRHLEECKLSTLKIAAIPPSGLIGRFVTAKLRGAIECRQGWVISVDPLRIRGESGTEYDCEGDPAIVINPPNKSAWRTDLPDDDIAVLARFDDDENPIDVALHSGQAWVNRDTGSFDRNVTGWMHLEDAARILDASPLT